MTKKTPLGLCTKYNKKFELKHPRKHNIQKTIKGICSKCGTELELFKKEKFSPQTPLSKEKNKKC